MLEKDSNSGILLYIRYKAPKISTNNKIII